MIPNVIECCLCIRKESSRKIFRPQFHGREHVNVTNWMKALQARDKYTLLAFQQNMFTVHTQKNIFSARSEFLDAFGNADELDAYSHIVKEGLDLFENIHGYTATSFIAPCYTWPSGLNTVLKDNGILYLQGGRVQKEPDNRGKKTFKKNYHFIGQRNENAQTYLVRNASFEVVENPDKDWVDSCLKEIETTFKYKKPAIISTHRVNFMSGINPQNRVRNLKKFKPVT